MSRFPVPILLVCFNRPKYTEEVFKKICEIKPEKLFVVADGPRPSAESDLQKCDEVRKIVQNVSWNCEKKYWFRKKNWGAARGVGRAISWFFTFVEMGIIIEDDCVPDISFFKYCHELLERYKDDQRIMAISGTNQMGIWNACNSSYFFSSYGTTWGWATWKRAWSLFDEHMETLPNFLNCGLMKKVSWNKKERIRMLNNFQQEDWDYKWQYAMRINAGLTIVPRINLVKNVGEGEDATHTKRRIIIESNSLEFPLKHPFFVLDDREYNYYRMKQKNNSKLFMLLVFLKRLVLRKR